MKNKDFFDATIEEKPSEVYEARAKAESHARACATITDKDIKRQDKSNFVKMCILCVASVLLCLILAIVFFLYVKWYGVGIGFALIGIILSQVWIKYFKKFFKFRENEEKEDFLDENMDKKE